MSEFEKSEKATLIIEQYKKGEFSKEVAERELRLLGYDLYEVRNALGQVQLNG